MSDIGNRDVFAKNLKYFMRRAGKTQKEMAEIIGVSTSTFNNWVLALKYPRIDKIEILANYFGILKSDLIEDKTKEREEMRKKNDTLSDIVIRLRSDKRFFSLVETLHNMDSEKLNSISVLLNVAPYKATEK